MDGNKLIEAAKKNAGLNSDYAMAEALGVSQQLMSNWKKGRSKPNGLYTLKICEVGKIEPAKAIEIMESGFGNVLVLLCIAFLSTMSLLLVTWPSALLGLQAFAGLASDLVYIMRSYRIIKRPQTMTNTAYVT